jgi:hypothetical protein
MRGNFIKENYKMDIKIGIHAEQRMQQRGIRPSLADMIINFADQETYIGGNCTSLWVSRKRAKQLCDDGDLSLKDAEKIRNKSVVISDDDEGSTVVTVMHMRNGQQGRHYRN